jgi:hypothetical protein
MATGRPDYTSQALMKGMESGVTIRTVAVDASGNIIGLIKGDYGGSLKTVALDSGGRLLVGQALVASKLSPGAAVCPAGALTTITTLVGTGVCSSIIFNISALANSHLAELGVYVDGVRAHWMSPQTMNSYGFGASTPHFSLTRYAADGQCDVLLTHVFEFQSSLAIKVQANTTDQSVTVDIYYAKIT